jgi:hypothetical protein
MISFNFICPHCRSKTIANVCYVERETNTENNKKIDTDNNNQDINIFVSYSYVMATCLSCTYPVVATIRTTIKVNSEDFNNIQIEKKFKNAVVSYYIEHSNYYPIIASAINVWPEVPEPYCHDSFPPVVKKAFVDLQRMFYEVKLETPALVISGCRSVLDVAIKDLGGKGANLKSQIDDLAGKGLVTGVLRDWAHQLRSEGNEAVHELKGTKEEAAELVKFVKFFLQYVYELPYEINRAKELDPSSTEII